jgi:hypothetical protein
MYAQKDTCCMCNRAIVCTPWGDRVTLEKLGKRKKERKTARDPKRRKRRKSRAAEAAAGL